MRTFTSKAIFDKLNTIESDVSLALSLTQRVTDIPDVPARDAQLLPTKEHPPKLGFSKIEGQARSLHDLASIELQAMELGLRTLVEFPEADKEFRKHLADITISEGQHLELCIKAMNELGFEWGHWPIHTTLWNASSAEDTLLERIFIVHRYLEGSGLDAGAQLCQRLAGVPGATVALAAVKRINEEEVDHVQFGSFWFKKICESQKLDSDQKFAEIILKLQPELPKRIEKLNHTLRSKAGFSDFEIAELESLRHRFISGELVG
jgi:uncharacterized ferritin-like protein (DUF455 family)